MEGRVRAPAQGPFHRDNRDPAMSSKSRVLGIKNNENETCHSRICNTPSVFATFVFQMSTLQRFYCFFTKTLQKQGTVTKPSAGSSSTVRRPSADHPPSSPTPSLGVSIKRSYKRREWGLPTTSPKSCNAFQDPGLKSRSHTLGSKAGAPAQV